MTIQCCPLLLFSKLKTNLEESFFRLSESRMMRRVMDLTPITPPLAILHSPIFTLHSAAGNSSFFILHSPLFTLHSSLPHSPLFAFFEAGTSVISPTTKMRVICDLLLVKIWTFFFTLPGILPKPL